jgi:pSer/pThr/pTyr-binding forkhead associated (FHA) protein
MSPMTVTLTVANGPLVGQAYEFREPAVYVLGRAAECYPRLPDELPYKDISRRHCLLSVSLPELRLLDLGSTNGTFVNGARLGPPAEGGPAPEGAPAALILPLHGQATGWHPLKDGDVIALGDSAVLRVRVQPPPPPRQPA